MKFEINDIVEFTDEFKVRFGGYVNGLNKCHKITDIDNDSTFAEDTLEPLYGTQTIYLNTASWTWKANFGANERWFKLLDNIIE